MMKMVPIALVAGLAGLAPAQAQQPPGAPPRQPTTDKSEPAPKPEAYAFAMPEPEDGLLRSATPVGPDRFGLRPDDVPPGVLPDGKVIEVEARIAVDAGGSVTACDEAASPLPALKGVLCRAVMARARFLPALDRSGMRVADAMPIKAQFISATVRTAPAPPPPTPGGYDDPMIRAQSQSLTLATAPDWARFHPGQPGEAVVRMTAFRLQPDGSASYYCTPLKPMEDRPSWQAACKAMEAAQYRTNPAVRTNELTALVLWLANGGAKLVTAPPGRPGKSMVWASPTAQQVPGITFDKKLWPQARLDFPVGSKTPRCRITMTTGDDSTDLAGCRHLETLKFTSPIDVFGRKFAVRQYVRIAAVPAPAPPVAATP